MNSTIAGSWRNRKVSRRALLGGAGAAAVGGAGLALGACGGGGDGALSVAKTERGPVVQQKQLRIRTGLTAWDPDQAFEGYTVFAPNRGTSAYVIDMEGKVVNQWDITQPDDQASVWYVDWLENGNLYVTVSSPDDSAPVFVFKGGTLMELDWEGNTVWELEDLDQHHDARFLPNGNILTLRTERLADDIVAQVQGGLAGSEGDIGMWADWIAEITREGETVWEWHASEHLDFDEDVVNPTDQRNEWTHANSVDQMPDGNPIVSFRNINTVVIIDRETGDIVWKLRAPEIAQQHNASPLPNGNVLIYDNGAHRVDGSLPSSRVIEINPANDEVVWEYQDPFLMNFFSPFISGAQRLPNGNTLITEGNFGRIFEVTQEHEVVWEYINEFLTVDKLLGENNSVFRAYRYPPDAFPEL